MNTVPTGSAQSGHGAEIRYVAVPDPPNGCEPFVV